MIYLLREGEVTRQGLSIYAPSEWKYSRGFVIRLWKRRLRVRYSVSQGRWLIRWESQLREPQP